MKKKTPPGHLSTPGDYLAASIRACLLEKGWTQGELARRAEISRTTLHHLLQGGTSIPHLTTISKIASALEMTPESLCPDFVVRSLERTPPKSDEESLPPSAEQQAFDRATNTYISEVYCSMPHLFSGWNHLDWNELYSTFGEGGALSPEGVIATAQQQNKKREVVLKLHVVLETNLRDVAINMINTLFESVQPSDNLVSTPELHALLNSADSPAVDAELEDEAEAGTA